MPEPNNNAGFSAFLQTVKRHWIKLLGGCTAIVLLGVFEKVSGKNIPWWAYLVLFAILFCIACYLAWQDARLELAQATATDSSGFQRDYLADRLKTLLRDAEESTLNDVLMIPGAIPINHYHAIREFLSRNYDEGTVKRFEKEGVSVIEKLIAECYSGDTRLANRNTIMLDKQD